MELDIFSGEQEYISASQASQKTGYAGDYVGQLCRAQKIPSKLVGRTWYVILPALLEHKRTRRLGRAKKSSLPSNFSYEADNRPNLPTLARSQVAVEETQNLILMRKAVALTLSLLIMVGAGTLAMKEKAPLFSPVLSQPASVSLFSMAAGTSHFFADGFQNLKLIALKSIKVYTSL